MTKPESIAYSFNDYFSNKPRINNLLVSPSVGQFTASRCARSDTKIEALKIANNSFHFTTILARVINKSFDQGVFPDHMKTAKLTP